MRLSFVPNCVFAPTIARESPEVLISTTEIPAAAIPPATAATNTSASISRSDDTVISAVLLAVLIVTLSPISARAFSSRLTCAIEAAKPIRPTDAPTTTE